MPPMTAPATAPPAAQAELSIAPRPPPARPPIALHKGQFPWLSTASPVLEVVTQPERTLLAKRRGKATLMSLVLMANLLCYWRVASNTGVKSHPLDSTSAAPEGAGRQLRLCLALSLH